ncbi:class D sortase [Neobacillus piezotolerans]|uniref:Class D sortase n=1 Tax=Neobacillus piezotolerans TaxID=2259171 RepID=A0A3D8GR49_9BACI|nr:class D sortase [Neobacillus piezotolerans]RDU36964.1 class D sortase [Neobacillus piezotolerans]
MRKKRRNIWRWVIISIPIFFLLIGGGIVAYFGFDLTKQTVLLAHTALNEYEPDLPDRQFEQVWPTLPAPGDKIGDLKFPSVGLDVPVVQGTHDNELKKGAGHLAGSALPGQGGNVVLSGHRDTVFRKLKDLKVGEEVIFTTPYGDFIYETTDFKITHADDMTVAVPTDFETLTLTTCYPFYFVGNAPDRFIVYTKLVSQPEITKH